MELTTILENINTQIDRYHNLQLNLVKEQSEILRHLTSNLYFLETYRIEEYEAWLTACSNSSGKSEAARKREADVEEPGIYRIRRIMTGAYKVVDSIRSTISIYKKEG